MTYEDLPGILKYEFHFSFSNSIARNIRDETQFLRAGEVKNLGEKILIEVLDKGYLNNGRIESRVCEEIFEKHRDDPCIQTVIENFHLEDSFKFTPLIGIKKTNTVFSVFLSLHG